MPGRPERGPDSYEGYDYQVVPIAGAQAVKTYRCPGCDHEIRTGTPHVVVWRVEDADGEGRRHWHTPCWRKRDHRGPTRRWS